MFNSDAHFLLALHSMHAEELRAEADADRLARSVRRPQDRDRTRSWRRRRSSGTESRAPALP